MPKAATGTTVTPSKPETSSDSQTVDSSLEERADEALMGLLGDDEDAQPGHEPTAPAGQEPAGDDNEPPDDGDVDVETDEPEDEESGESDEDEESDEETDDALSPEAQHALDRRIAKEVAKRKRLEAELAEERRRREELESQDPSGGDPPAAATLDPQDPAVAKLVKRQESLQAAKSNARRLLRDLDAEEDGQGKTGYDRVVEWLKGRQAAVSDWTPAGLRAWLEDQIDYANDTLAEVRSEVTTLKREQVRTAQAQRVEFDRKAVEAYPWVSDAALRAPKSPEGRLAVQFWPTFRNYPHGRLMMADLIAGKLAREARKSGNGAPAKPKRAPAIAGRPTAAAPSNPTPESKREARIAKARTTGSDADIEDAVASML